MNYNPEKNEDFSCYYRTYNSCDYNGTGIQLKACGEVNPTEEDLIAPAGVTLTSKYELIEYVNDVNCEYVEVLVEQNINGRTDTTYTYGVDRISKELFNQTNRPSYYLYDPRGSVAGLADAKGHLTKTYQYSPTGELTHGAAAHENEYTYNGESYNPNIQSQYLRARYYSVVTANFLTEDSYLGSINEPLTLNRYNYCISSYPNYEDPSGNDWSDLGPLGTEVHERFGDWAEENFPNAEQKYPVENYEYSLTGKGYIDVVLFTSGGMEVYELKRGWQASIYGKDVEEIGKERSIREPFLPGWKQREGYIKALRQKDKLVNESGDTIGEYIRQKGLEIPITDDYTARFYAYADQPGMIYYNLIKKKDPDPRKRIPLALVDSGKNAERRGKIVRCVTIDEEKLQDNIAAIVGVEVAAVIAEMLVDAYTVGSGLVTQMENMFLIPISYDVWELQLEWTMPPQSGKVAIS